MFKQEIRDFILFTQHHARVTELVYVVDLKSAAVRHVGSIPTPGTSSNLVGIKNMERLSESENPALIFAKTLSACGGSREIP